MSKDRVVPYLAIGCNNKVAIKALMALRRKDVDAGLALNPYLDGFQIDTLLDTCSSKTKAIVASRLDLTVAHMKKIINGKSGLARQALLTRGSDLSMHLPKKLINIPEEIVAQAMGSDWFAPEYAKSLLDLISKSSPLRQKLAEEATTPTTWAKTSGFKGNKERIEDLLRINFYPRYIYIVLGRTVKGIDSDSELESNPVDQPLPSLIQGFIYKEGATPAIICRLVDDLLPEGVSPEFYTLFFSLLPDWQLSIKQAVETCLSIVESKPQSN